MSKLQQLIQTLCPNGVEFIPLKDVATIKNGKDYKHCSSGDIPVYGSGGIMTYVDQYCYNKPTVLLPRKGSIGKTHYVDTPFWNVDTVYYTEINVRKMCPKFLYYYLQTIDLEKMNCGKGAVPSLTQEILYRIKIPIPPIEVQEEIVKILDRFSDYAAELQAELQARKEQYEYYRNLLLTFNPSACGCGTDDEQKNSVTTWGGDSYEIIWKTMGEIGTFIRGNGLQKKDFTESGVGCIHYGQIYTHYGTFATETKSFVSKQFAQKLKKANYGDLIIATTSENVEDVGKAVAWLGKDEIAISGDAYIFSHSENPKYIAYLLQTYRFLQFKRMNVSGTKVTRISGESLAKFIIPVPPLELQEKIVAILDKFEALTNDLQSGLPAEIEAVKERYEYYRNKLLTFNPLSA